MARGRAVIGSSTSAIPEVVAHGETGLVPPGDTAALASVIITLLNDETKRLEMGRRGREWVKRLFSESTMVERVIELSEHAIGNRP